MLLLGMALLTGCGGQSPQGTVRLMLTDNPIDALAINVSISRVDVIREDEGIFTVVDQPQTFELLSLAGAETLLGETGVSPGHYEQIRLIVSEATITTPEGTFPLEIASGEQTGIKLVCDFDVLQDEIVVLLLDFDVAHSVHQQGNGKYLMTPVTHVIPENVAGKVIGVLDPAEARAGATITLSDPATGDPVASAYPKEEDGSFVSVVREGAYDLKAEAAGYDPVTKTGVVVTAEQTTDVGTITLTPNSGGG